MCAMLLPVPLEEKVHARLIYSPPTHPNIVEKVRWTFSTRKKRCPTHRVWEHKSAFPHTKSRDFLSAGALMQHSWRAENHTATTAKLAVTRGVEPPPP